MSLPRALARGALAGLACGSLACGAAWGLWWVSRLLHGDRPGGAMMHVDSVRAVTVEQLLLLWGSGVACGTVVALWVGDLLRREG